jgi:HAD superfamily hydrolase (TIGR01509 family)
MVKAIVFDCFGVLVTEGWLPFKQHYFGGNSELFDEVSELRRQVDVGLLGYQDFLQQVAKLAAVQAATVRDAVERNVANEELFAYITELKPQYKIGMLSNAGSDRLKQLFTPEQLALFDETSLSFESGVVKPDPEAYKAMAASLGVSPEEVVFVDDQERHCGGAHQAGMQAILYKDVTQLRADLGKLLANSEK